MIVTPDVMVVEPVTNLQDAIDATPAGGRLFLGPGSYVAPSGGLQITKSIEMFGNQDISSTLIMANQSNAADQPVIVIDATGITPGTGLNGIYLHDLRIGQGAAATGHYPTSHGIQVKTAANTTVGDLHLHRVSVWNVGGDGLHIEGTNGTAGAVVGVDCRDVYIKTCQGAGFMTKYATVVKMDHCISGANKLYGYYYESCSTVTLENCGAESNCQRTSDYAGLGYTVDYGAQIRFKTSFPAVVTCCHIEEFTAHPTYYAKQGIILENSPSSSLISNFLVNGVLNNAQENRGIYILSGSHNSVIAGNYFQNVLREAWVADTGENGLSIFSNLNTGVGSHMGIGISVPALADADRQTPGSTPGQLVWSTTNNRLEVWTGAAWAAV